ncbi:hypothetical protein [Halomonas sp. JB37]|uniref:hypothetical protein n=1 Tax=Halomonas sp. JB37 TaxID=2024405 RepID=UPI000BB85825|nr:hypothetical protein [Halomonas sp. JB37]PCC23051.1 hypothetical protein CIK78_13845 [Halomonas sp. JB37]
MFTEASSLDISSEAIIEKMGRYGVGPQLIAYEAELDEATVTWISKYVFLCEKAGKKILFHDVRGADSYAANSVTDRRVLLRKLLKHAGVNVPKARIVKSLNAAKRARKAFGGTLSLWSTSTAGKSVNVGKVSTERRLERELEKCFEVRSSVLTEEHIEGSVYRVMVVGDKVVAALSRRPATLVGDGNSTIQELIEIKNQARDLNPCYRNKPIRFGRNTESNMQKRGLTVDSILPEGDSFEVRSSLALAAGAEFVDATNDLTPTLEKLAIQAVASIPGLEVASVDVVISSKGNDAVPYVLDVSCDPNIAVYHYPGEGKQSNIAQQIWKHAAASI